MGSLAGSTDDGATAIIRMASRETSEERPLITGGRFAIPAGLPEEVDVLPLRLRGGGGGDEPTCIEDDDEEVQPGPSGLRTRRGSTASCVSRNTATSHMTQTARKRQADEDDLPDFGSKKFRIACQKAVAELEDVTTEDLEDTVAKQMEKVEDQISKSKNIQGGVVKQLREALARISSASMMLGRRARASPGEDSLDELRLELRHFKKGNDKLRKDLSKANEEIAKLKTQCAAALLDSPKRTARGTSVKVRRTYDSDSETENNMDPEPETTMEVEELGDTLARTNIDGQRASNTRETRSGTGEMLPPVYRPSLQGVSRRLDENEPRPLPQQTREERGNQTASELRGVIIAVLRELGLTGQKAPENGNAAPVIGTVGPGNTSKSKPDAQKRKKKGKVNKKGPGEVLPLRPALPSSKESPTGSSRKDLGVSSSGATGTSNEKGAATNTRQTGANRGQDTSDWTLVASNKKRRATTKAKSKDEAGQASQRTADRSQGQNQARGRGGNKPPNKLGSVPRSQAVVVSAPPGSYGEVMRAAREKIPLEQLGITELRPRRALTGALILEVVGDKEGVKANSLAERLSEALAGKEGVTINRPYKKADLRIRDLDESVSARDIAQAIARIGECSAELVKVGEIKYTPGGMGTVWAQCPLTAAKKVTASKRIRCGWLSYRVEALPPRGLQCYRCLGAGHTGAKCTSSADRSNCCYRCGGVGHRANACSLPLECPTCKEAGRNASHKIGSVSCMIGPGGGKKRLAAANPAKVSNQAEQERPGRPTSRPTETRNAQLPLSGAEQLPPRERRLSRDQIEREQTAMQVDPVPGTSSGLEEALNHRVNGS